MPLYQPLYGRMDYTCNQVRLRIIATAFIDGLIANNDFLRRDFRSAAPLDYLGYALFGTL